MSHRAKRAGHNRANIFYMSQTKKSPFFISRNTKSRQLSPTFVLQQTFVHYKTLQKGAGCPTPFAITIEKYNQITVREKELPGWTDLPVQA